MLKIIYFLVEQIQNKRIKTQKKSMFYFNQRQYYLSFFLVKLAYIQTIIYYVYQIRIIRFFEMSIM